MIYNITFNTGHLLCCLFFHHFLFKEYFCYFSLLLGFNNRFFPLGLGIFLDDFLMFSSNQKLGFLSLPMKEVVRERKLIKIKAGIAYTSS